MRNSPFEHLRAAMRDLPASKIREIANAGMDRDDTIPLWFGEPDQPTPQFICDAAAAALRDGDTFYTPNLGIPELRAVLSSYMSKLYDADIDFDRVTVSVSGMNALMLVLQCLVDTGDGVVTTAPLWPNLPSVPVVLGGAVRSVPLRPAPEGWHLDLDHLFDACDETTRVIMINSPNNPTGWTMTADQQRAVLDFARARGLWVVSDEVYARIVYDRAVAPSFLQIAEPDDRVIVVNSFSKTWSMTGWRLGWITAPASVTPALEKLMEFNIAGAPGFCQRAGVVAVQQGEEFVTRSVARYHAARDLVVDRLTAFPRVSLPYPPAAFYAFFSVDGVDDSLAFAKKVLAETGVGLAPGEAFGEVGQGWLRLCFAAAGGSGCTRPSIAWSRCCANARRVCAARRRRSRPRPPRATRRGSGAGFSPRRRRGPSHRRRRQACCSGRPPPPRVPSPWPAHGPVDRACRRGRRVARPASFPTRRSWC